MADDNVTEIPQNQQQNNGGGKMKSGKQLAIEARNKIAQRKSQDIAKRVEAKAEEVMKLEMTLKLAQAELEQLCGEQDALAAALKG